ncbi:hypothetical protein ACA910_006184 [Epithemia clementina (nom. ined.)]
MICAVALLERSVAVLENRLVQHPNIDATTTSLTTMTAASQTTPTSRNRTTPFEDSHNLNRATTTTTATLILAAVPRGPRYATALWTQLECLADPTKYLSIVVVAPTWAQEITTRIVEKARRDIPHFATHHSTLSSSPPASRALRTTPTTSAHTAEQTNTKHHFYENPRVSLSVLFKLNDRYDVGLWCDALRDLGLHNTTTNTTMKDAFFVLSNDSIFALRPFTDILDQLQTNPQLALTSLNYHYNLTEDLSDLKENRNNDNHHHNHENRTASSSYWVESILRGFSASAIKRYWDYACTAPPRHALYCPGLRSKIKKKRCIVENFEIAIASLFEPSQVLGLYPSSSMTTTTANNNSNNNNTDTATISAQSAMPESQRWGTTWVSNHLFWNNVLRQEYNFPAAKTKNPRMVVQLTPNNTLLHQCTQYMDWNFILHELNYNNSMGILEIPIIMGKRKPNKTKARATTGRRK